MPALVERSATKNKVQPFSPPEWEIVPFPKPSQIDSEKFLRKENLGSEASPYEVTILDEHILDQGGNTELIIQWILGHHRQRLPKAYEHQGCQGNEMIRKMYRRKIVCGDRTVAYSLKEEDISKENSLNCNRWGRVLSNS